MDFFKKQTNILVILGATGSGKTALSISLAKALSGEIINADAMQLYDGLSITTNKASIHEQEGITHHLLGCMDPKLPSK